MSRIFCILCGIAALSLGIAGCGGSSSSSPFVISPTGTPTMTPGTPSPTPTPTGPPAISSLTPSSAVAGGEGFTLTVAGKNFTALSIVQWNGKNLATTFLSDTELEATIPASNIASIGASNVAVSNSATGGVISPPSSFFTGSSGVTDFATVTIDQQTNDLIFDPVRQVIYLSVPGSAPAYANTIAVLNLATASINSSEFVGSNPDVLSLTDDNRYLYAGIDGSASVKRLILPGLGTDISYYLGDLPGGGYALDLQAAPGAPQTTAVTLGTPDLSPAAEGGVVIYDNATPRPTRAPGFSTSGHVYGTLQWGSDASVLFAADNETSSADLFTLSVNASGVTLANDYEGLFSEYAFQRIHFDRGTGLIYADNGKVVNPSGMPVGVYSAAGSMVLDSSLNRAFFGILGSPSTEVESFNQNEFTPIETISIPGETGTPNRIIRWGQNGLAFNTFEGHVVLIGGNFVH